MTQNHNFCYLFSFYSSLCFKEGREKGKRISKVVILSHAFLLDRCYTKNLFKTFFLKFSNISESNIYQRCTWKQMYAIEGFGSKQMTFHLCISAFQQKQENFWEVSSVVLGFYIHWVHITQFQNNGCFPVRWPWSIQESIKII